VLFQETPFLIVNFLEATKELVRWFISPFVTCEEQIEVVKLLFKEKKVNQ